MSNTDKRGVIAGIQYLRGFAAMTVVWFHALNAGHGVRPILGDAYLGGSGVDLFFVISGFIMVVTTVNRDVTPWKFLELRIIRVVPLYWLMTFTAILLAPLGHHFKGMQLSGAAILKSLFFIPYESLDFPGRLWPILVQGWTLNYEIFFYLLFAVSLGFKRGRLASISLVLVALAISGALLSPSLTSPLSIYTSLMMLEFVVGMWIAMAYLRGSIVPLWFIAWAVPAGIYLLAENHDRWQIMVGAGALVLAGLHPRIGASRPLLALGDASYSIYLLHPFVLAALSAIWSKIFPQATFASSLGFMLVACTLVMVAGWITYRWMERPITAALRGLLGQRTAPPAPAVSGGARS